MIYMVPIYILLYILVIKVVERVSELNNIYMFVLVSLSLIHI